MLQVLIDATVNVQNWFAAAFLFKVVYLSFLLSISLRWDLTFHHCRLELNL
jgi:hypothetical protein